MPLASHNQKPIHRPADRHGQMSTLPQHPSNPSRDLSQLPRREGHLVMQQQPTVQDQGHTTAQKRREHAETLKVQVPDTMAVPGPKHQMSRSTSDGSDRASELKAPVLHVQFREHTNNATNNLRPLPTQSGPEAHPADLDSDESGGEDAPPEQTAVYRPLHTDLPLVSRSQSQPRRFNLSSAPQLIHIGEDWMEESDSGRVMRGVQPHYTTVDQLGDIQGDDSILGDPNDTQEVNDYLQILQDSTPSRVDATRPRDLRNFTHKGGKSIAEQSQRFSSHVQAAAVIKHPDQSTHTRAAVDGRAVPSKIFSYHEPSSDDDRDQPQPMPTASSDAATDRPAKRSHHEVDLDYSPNTLKQMSFNDLSTAPFLTDPNTPAFAPPLDGHGNAISLAARLNNLTKMAPQAQNALFHGLSDEENSQTGEWFVSKFEEELKRLMNIRLERRKITLRFEDEVRRREVLIHRETVSVDGELRGLKKGGGELISGRLGSVEANN